MAENPPLNRFYVLGYSANDKDFPIISANFDPRVAGYKVPEDLSTCPDKRYPNHVFTGAQPLSGDERVRHVWEILPSPYVPFTRYDDDLGPVQGRRRSVKNEGQVASREADKQVTYEAREGSAIVYTELEEAWSIKTDEDGNSFFPIKDRDIYDERLGPIKERRQLFVPTGEEKASLEYNDPTITQTTYEPYNEYLSYKVITTYDLSGPVRREDIYEPLRGSVQRLSQVIYDDGTNQGSLTNESGVITQISYQPINTLVVDKIIETYSVGGPQLVGRTTDNNSQLITVTTQRKASDGYAPPQPTATRTVEVSREDAESLIERISDAPEVFDGRLLSSQKPDTVPEKFRVNNPLKRSEEIIAGSNVSVPTLGQDDYFKSEQRATKYTLQRVGLQRTSTYETLSNQRLEEAWNVKIPYTEYISNSIPASEGIEAEAIGGGRYLIREYSPNELNSILGNWLVIIPSSVDINMPKVLESVDVSWQEEKSIGEVDFDASGLEGQFNGLTQKDNGSISSTLTLVPKIEATFNDPWGSNLPCEVVIFFLKKQNLTIGQILQKAGAQATWPTFKPKSFSTTVFGISETKTLSASISRSISFTNAGDTGYQPTKEHQTDFKRNVIPVSLNFPPCLTPSKTINLSRSLQSAGGSIKLSYDTITTTNGETFLGPSIEKNLTHSITINDSISIPATDPVNIPKSGTYLVNSAIEPFKFDWFLIRATVFDASELA